MDASKARCVPYLLIIKVLVKLAHKSVFSGERGNYSLKRRHKTPNLYRCSLSEHYFKTSTQHSGSVVRKMVKMMRARWCSLREWRLRLQLPLYRRPTGVDVTSSEGVSTNRKFSSRTSYFNAPGKTPKFASNVAAWIILTITLFTINNYALIFSART